jgi:NAD(P)-dependent dehydrogenase (short-subunit alcohol dehydrogenase family)
MLIPRSYPYGRIQRLYDINVHGAFFTAREAARNMIPQGGGSIVLIASMSANVRSGFLLPCFRLTIRPDRQHPAGAPPVAPR